MISKIGIDAGGSFTKISYEDDSRLHHKLFLSSNMHETSNWINLLFPHAKKIITGGKAETLITALKDEVEMVSEFDASLNGVKYLLHDEFQVTLDQYLIVIIGTGTSIMMAKNGKQTRVTGTGMGGGTFLGLGALLTGISQYEKLVELDSIGNRQNIDLMVADIYANSETPIPGDLTAANFAKGSISEQLEHSDKLASLVNMIAETICLLIQQIVSEHKMKHVVCIGGGIKGNAPLQSALQRNLQLMKLTSYFPRVGQFAGSIGALYNDK